MITEKRCIVAVLIFGCIAPFVLSTYGLTALISILYYGLLAFSLGFLIRNVGMVSLCQTAFFGLAGYMIGIFGVNAGWPFPWPPLIGLAVAFLAAFFFGCIALRTYDISFLMITLAIGQLCWALSNQWMSVFRGYDGIQGIRPPVIGDLDYSDTKLFYYTLFAVFTIIVLGLRKLVDSHFGLALRGIKESPDRMAALGYAVFGLRLAAFVLAGMVAAVGGIFSVYFTGIITPGVLGLERTIWILLIVILGGASYFWGPLFGAVFVIVLDLILRTMTERYDSIIGLIFLIIVLFSVDKGLGKLLEFLPRPLKAKKQTGRNDIL